MMKEGRGRGAPPQLQLISQNASPRSSGDRLAHAALAEMFDEQASKFVQLESESRLMAEQARLWMQAWRHLLRVSQPLLRYLVLAELP